MKLTPKQKAFVREYKANGGNGTQAAIKAGYSENTADVIATENLRKPNIKEALAQAEKKMQEKYEYTLDDMVRELDDVKLKADAEQNRQAQIKAIELKGKAFGLFIDRQEITGKDGKDLIPVIEIQPVKVKEE
ncbi:MAG: terminase small subunit [Methanobrevibacter sp.]|nr:terminase small subunit [Methanobrevibacter sp.]